MKYSNGLGLITLFVFTIASALSFLFFQTSNIEKQNQDANVSNFLAYSEEDGWSMTYGCMDPSADNYDPNATSDDATCQYTSRKGCTNGDAINYDSYATIDDGSCIVKTPKKGCTLKMARNYDPTATISDAASCDITVESIMQYNNTKYSTTAVTGCMDVKATNYNAKATKAGACTYAFILGCNDSKALNYDSKATLNNGSCKYAPVVTTPKIETPKIDTAPKPLTPSATAPKPTLPTAPVPAKTATTPNLAIGCKDPKSDTYNSKVGIHDQNLCSYTKKDPVCGDKLAVNYDWRFDYPPYAKSLEHTPSLCKYGFCPDPIALNYDPDGEARGDEPSYLSCQYQGEREASICECYGEWQVVRLTTFHAKEGDGSTKDKDGNSKGDANTALEKSSTGAPLRAADPANGIAGSAAIDPSLFGGYGAGVQVPGADGLCYEYNGSDTGTHVKEKKASNRIDPKTGEKYPVIDVYFNGNERSLIGGGEFGDSEYINVCITPDVYKYGSHEKTNGDLFSDLTAPGPDTSLGNPEPTVSNEATGPVNPYAGIQSAFSSILSSIGKLPTTEQPKLLKSLLEIKSLFPEANLAI